MKYAPLWPSVVLSLRVPLLLIRCVLLVAVGIGWIIRALPAFVQLAPMWPSVHPWRLVPRILINVVLLVRSVFGWMIRYHFLCVNRVLPCRPVNS